MWFPHLLVVANEDEVLAIFAQRGDGVSLKNFCSLLDDHQTRLQLLQDLPVFGRSCGRHPNDLFIFVPYAQMQPTLKDSLHS